MKTRVKICGITSLKDASLAADLGACAVGFIFYTGSKRYVSCGKAREIANRLPPFVVKVGVFVNESRERMMEIKEYCMLDRIQVYGDSIVDVDPVDGALLHGITILAHRIRNAEDLEKVKKTKMFPLLDSYREKMYGGNGKKFDWDLLKGFDRPYILAGGIHIGNIDKALELRPYAIDIASGVEKAPGIKDPDKMRDIFKKIE